VNDDEKIIFDFFIEYSKKYNNAREIMGVLLYTFGLDEALEILKKANGRKIIVNDVPGIDDGVKIVIREIKE
jgi:hypothetical protein